MRHLRQIVTHETPKDPYFPYIAALDKGVIDSAALEPQTPDTPISITLQSGHIPVEEAGTVKLAGDAYAIDHAAVLYVDEKELVLGPAHKSGVTPEGEILDPGALTLTHLPTGLIKVIGEVVTGNVSPWINPGIELGRAATLLYGLDSIVVEPQAVDEGIIRTRLWTPGS